jgi:hypothetical protein
MHVSQDGADRQWHDQSSRLEVPMVGSWTLSANYIDNADPPSGEGAHGTAKPSSGPTTPKRQSFH